MRFKWTMLHRVENWGNTFFMYITGCVSLARIIPRRRIKLGGRMVCSVAHEAKGGREKKKTTTRNGIESQPLSTIYPSQLALNSWSELWVTLSTTCSALRVKEGLFWFLTGKSDYSSSGFNFETTTPIQGLCFTTPEMWLKKKTAEN